MLKPVYVDIPVRCQTLSYTRVRATGGLPV